MNLQILTTIIGALGIGSIIGVVITALTNYRLEKEKMLFTSRVKAYSNLSGRVFNLFLEPDITSLREDALIWAKINQLLSEAYLLGSPSLIDLIGEFKTKVFQFHVALGKKNDKESAKIHKELLPLAEKIFDQMRKDVFISKKRAWKE